MRAGWGEIQFSRLRETMDVHEKDLKPMEQQPENRCFACGPDNPAGLHMEFFVGEDGSIFAFPVISGAFDGYPGNVHGGMIATMLDEVMSKSVRQAGYLAMTRHIEVDYVRPVPSSARLRIEGRITGDEGRKHWTQGRIRDEEGKILARAKGLFVEVKRPDAEGADQ
jgi:uncharacterized protein (TIGR00369 family)